MIKTYGLVLFRCLFLMNKTNKQRTSHYIDKMHLITMNISLDIYNSNSRNTVGAFMAIGNEQLQTVGVIHIPRTLAIQLASNRYSMNILQMKEYLTCVFQITQCVSIIRFWETWPSVMQLRIRGWQLYVVFRQPSSLMLISNTSCFYKQTRDF